MTQQKQLKQSLIAAALCAMMSLPAAAQTTMAGATKGQVKEAYSQQKSACDALSGNQKDVCVEKAKARKEVGLAEVKHSKDNSERSLYNLNKTRADAEYEVAKEMCDALSGDAEDACEKQAKANHVAGVEAAKLVKKTDKAVKEAVEEVDDAQRKADRAACDTLSGAQKDNCVRAAKMGGR